MGDGEFPQASFQFLRFHLLWPKSGETITIWFILRILLVYSIPGFQITLSFLHLFVTIYYKKNCAITDDIVVVFVGLFFAYTFVVYLMNIKEIVQYIERLQEFHRFGKPENLQKFTQEHNRTMKILYYYCFIAVLICVICEYLSIPKCERKNLKNGTENLCGFLVNYWLPFNLNEKYSIRIFMHLFQTLFALASCLPGITQTYLGVTLIDSLTLRLEEVRKAFAQVSNLSTIRMKKQQIKYATEYHIETIQLIDDFNLYLGKFSSVHFGLSSIIIGILNYQALQDFQVKGAFNLFGWFSIMAILCNAGQNLIDKSVQISEELYELEWYNMNCELKSMIKLLILRSQNQLSINSGFFYYYSHQLLHKVMEASYTYMTILIQINARRQNKVQLFQHN